jgi:hypothetical protein
LVFLLTERVTSLYPAVAAGTVAAVIVFARAGARRQVHMLDVAAPVYFAALGGVLADLQPKHLEAVARFAQAGSHVALTVLIFGSILVGRPFTESYARRTTPKAEWHTPLFHSLNRQISKVWGLAFLVGAVSLIAAGTIHGHQALLRIIIPFGSLYYAYTYTQQKTAALHQAADHQTRTEPAIAAD